MRPPHRPAVAGSIKKLARTARLIHGAIDQLQVDLEGLTVLTEAATGAFAVTAAIAGAAGASRVHAIARDSRFGSAREASEATLTMAEACGVADRITVVHAQETAPIAVADLVTNLGFVRPIDARFVAQLKPTSVVALMCEGWEARPGDVDIDACHGRGILVLGTNENDPSWPVFSYSGPLAIRMLFEAGFEVLHTRVAVIGTDNFAPVIAEALRGAGAVVSVARELTVEALRSALSGAEAVMLAEYASDRVLLGERGILEAGAIADLAPGACVVQFAGALHEQSLRNAGIGVWPNPPVPARRMSLTLAGIGVRPVVALHAAGLAVGALGARLRRQGLSAPDALHEAMRRSPLVQEVRR